MCVRFEMFQVHNMHIQCVCLLVVHQQHVLFVVRHVCARVRVCGAPKHVFVPRHV